MTVESGALIRAFSHLEGCIVRSGAIVGPFARLRPLLGKGIRANAICPGTVQTPSLEDRIRALQERR